jgi:hypothetical protein
VGLLGEHGLPVVAGPVTGDRMIDSSPHYYQVSPRNRRVASMLVSFSTATEVVRTDEGELAVPDGAVIVMDHSDEYSQNLAYDLHEAFVGTGRTDVTLISYPVEDEELPLETPFPGSPAATRVGSLDQLAHQVCAELDDRDVVFFASRSQQFGGMLESMHDDNDCPDAFTVVAGSAITKVMENPSAVLPQDSDVSVYYAAFASRSDELDDARNRSADEFARLYGEAHGGGEGTDVSDAVLAYDAFDALQRTANYARQNHYPISAGTSAEALGGGEIEFDGASGHIALGNQPLGSERARVPSAKPVLVLPAGEARRDRVLVCGRFTEDDEAERWGENRPCPRDD